jgi:hypothetical protein
MRSTLLKVFRQYTSCLATEEYPQIYMITKTITCSLLTVIGNLFLLQHLQAQDLPIKNGFACQGDVISKHPQAQGIQEDGWINGPLVEVLADSIVKEVDEYSGMLPIGHPAFHKLEINKANETNTLIVTGIVCSTNSGGLRQGAAVYVGYSNGHIGLVAMSNLNGEVLFSVAPMVGSDAKQIVPTLLYVASHPLFTPSLKGAILRKYSLEAKK